MTTTMLILFLSITLVGVVLSAMYSGLETGLYTINPVRLAVRAGRDDRAARRLRLLRNNPHRMLSMLLIGNNIANYAGSYGIAAILDRLDYSPVQAIALNAGVLIPLLFVFGEVLPKDLFRTHTDRWTYTLSVFLQWSTWIYTALGLVPVVELVGRTAGRVLGGADARTIDARQRISHLIKEGRVAGVLSEAQTTLADRALAFRDRRVADEMVPWRQAIVVQVDATTEMRTRLLRGRNVTRMPVVDGSGEVVGILDTLDVALDPESPTRDLMHSPVVIDAGLPVAQALQQLRTSGQTIAIVVRPGTEIPVGLVTWKDLVEPLTGELEVW